MKLSYSTRGWADFSWTDNFRQCKELGFEGFELAWNRKEISELLDGPNAASRRQSITRRLVELELSIPCLSVGSNLGDPSLHEAACGRIEDCIRLASLMKIPYVNLKAAKYGFERDEALVISAIERLLPQA